HTQHYSDQLQPHKADGLQCVRAKLKLCKLLRKGFTLNTVSMFMPRRLMSRMQPPCTASLKALPLNLEELIFVSPMPGALQQKGFSRLPWRTGKIGRAHV